MEHAREIWGTVFTAVFTIMSAVFIKLFWVDAIAPFWVALIGTIVLGGTALWACFRVAWYWIHKIKSRAGRK